MRGRSPLVGRLVEREALDAALRRCAQGNGGLILVSGEAGAGKSRLVAEALTGWDGAVVHSAACVGEGPYAPVVGFLRSVRDRFGKNALAEDARVLLPELAMPWREVDQASLVAAIAHTLRGIAARQPSVVVLEDLHWANAASVDLLPRLAASVTGASLLLLATYRSEELPRTHPLRRVRSELRRAGGVLELALAPLTRAETAELLAGLFEAIPLPRLVTAVHDRAEGLPFFIEELAAALVETGRLADRNGAVELIPGAELPLPESVLDAVLVRTARLRRQHEEAVELAAVLGTRVDLPVLADVVPAQEVDELLEAGLLVERESHSAVFRHSLVRDAIYRAIPWARRRSHHRRVAEILAARHVAPEVIAEHWIAGHEHDRARPLLLAAAEQCCSVYAYRDAAALVRRALGIWPDGADEEARLITLERMADCAELCGELDEAAAAWAEVADDHRSSANLERAGVAYRRLANAAGLLGEWSRAVDAREAAAEMFALAGERIEAALERLALAEQLESAAQPTRALEHAVAAANDAEVAGRVDLHAHALALQGAIRAAMGDDRHGVELSRSALELALAAQLNEAAGASYYDFASALIYAADYAAAANAYQSAAELCREHGIDELAHACVACMAVAVRFLGDWDRALAIAGEVLADERTSEVARMVAEEEAGLITALRGDRRRARARLRRAAGFGSQCQVFGIEIGATWGLAVVAELDGDDSAAGRTVSRMLERCSATELSHFALPPLRWAATFLACRSDTEDLARCHRLLASAATHNSAPKVLSALAHAGGEMALLEGSADEAAALFGRAVELLQSFTSPFEHALSQLRWGAALAQADDRSTAIDTVTGAYRTARHLGAKPLARSCAAELDGMGEQVDRRLGRLAARALAPAGLTRREQEVLRLVATGQTNRDIAKALYISQRTVDMHVRNVLAKLGCRSRVAAARRAVEIGLG